MKQVPYAVFALLAALLCALLAEIGWTQPSGEPLPRRAALGVTLAIDSAGAVVASVVPDGTAAAGAGMEVGDTIAALDGTPVTSIVQVQSIVGRHRGGDSLTIDIVRGGQAQRLVAELHTFPFEQLPNTVFEYGHLSIADGIRLRTIVSQPAATTAPVPAVLFLQGGGCSSIDVPWASPEIWPYSLISAIAARGFVTMRVDKPGAGESEGPPCAEGGFHAELAGYRAALLQLMEDPAVDPRRVFLFGDSLGGFVAPLLANETRVAGISAYGTIAFTPTGYPGRSDLFFREIADVDILVAWGRIDVPVQLLHGTFDAVSTASDHAKIAAIVNGAHPGLAVHREFEGVDHCGTRQETAESGRDNCGGGAQVPELIDVVLDFIDKPSNAI
jgi:pimeloyl-ACP methyl ester carboxylesterase